METLKLDSKTQSCIKMDEDNNSFQVWQWNSCGLSTKINALKMHILNAERQPDIIGIQESSENCNIPGYDRYDESTASSGKIVHTFVRRSLPVKLHDISLDQGSKAIITEIIPKKKNQRSLLVCHVYSPPKDISDSIATIFQKAETIAGHNHILVIGDFNAENSSWGYQRDSRKGKKIEEQADTYNAILMNDITAKTRIGNSVQRDTNPDLAFGINIEDYRWTNSRENLGSDHYIIHIALTLDGHRGRNVPNQTYTNWDAFRNLRNEGNRPLQDIEEWAAKLVDDHQSVTRKIENPTQARSMDDKLKNMLDAYKSLYERWLHTGKRYPKLRRRAARLCKEIEVYAQLLNQQLWQQNCDELQGQLHTKNPWPLFRRLLAPEETKTEKRKLLAKIVRDHEGSMDNIFEELKEIYLKSPSRNPIHSKHYAGDGNVELDAPITEQETRKAIMGLKTSSAPGADRVTNKMLRNLDNDSIRLLTEYFNQIWNASKLPRSFKHAIVCFIPKPGKPLELKSLRPISLTSCIGKLLERIIQTRVQDYMEEHGLFTDQMFGFRRNLSTQDVFIQLQEDSCTEKWKALAALDLRKAFDRVSHAAILDQVERLGLGERTFLYFKDFLTGRTATMQVEGESSAVFGINEGSGTPQGSVLSPLLFNIAMIPLSRRLQEIGGLCHAIYADDITLWTSLPSPQMGNVISAGVSIVKEEASKMGLECAADKSALLLRMPKSPTQAKDMEFYLKLQKIDIPRVTHTRVLGLEVSVGNRQNEIIKSIKAKAGSTARLIRRVSNRNYGLKEDDSCKLIHAFTLSRIMYAAPYMNLSKSSKGSIDATIRKSFKTALSIPQTTSNEVLENFGIHNTFDEMVLAQREAQITRLSKTATGRTVLRLIGEAERKIEDGKTDVPRVWLNTTYSTPLPKNMNTDRNQGRRRARAKALNKFQANLEHIFHADAGPYPGRSGTFVIAVHNAKQDATATIKASNIDEAEEAAVALARIQAHRLQQKIATITTDSKTAILNMCRGRVGATAAKLLGKTAPDQEARHTLTWVPGHSGHLGNEAAHSLVARALNYRATRGEGLPTTQGDHSYGSSPYLQGPLTYGEALRKSRYQRKLFGMPHKKLSRAQECTWRMLQSRNTLTPRILRRSWPDLFSGRCEECNLEEGTWSHVYWTCPRNPLPSALTTPEEDVDLPAWESFLAFEDYETQLKIIEHTQAIEKRLRMQLETRRPLPPPLPP